MVHEILLHDAEIPDYDHISWDNMPQSDRERFALMQAKSSAIFAKEHVPFYREHFKNITQNQINDIKSLEEFSIVLPETTKEHLTTTHPSKFLPEYEAGTALINKGTGGSTGKPVTIFYSKYDWTAMAQNIARSIKFDFRENLDDLRGRQLVGLYHGDHVTNEIYRSGLGLLGISLLGRPSTKSESSHVYDFIQDVKPNGILAPPEDRGSKQTKGITLDRMLIFDAKNSKSSAYRLNNTDNKSMQMVLWSSMPLSPQLHNYLKDHLKIPYIQGQYGSTECCPTGATCEYNPFSFHLCYGPNLVTVVHPSNERLVKDSEEGFILVTKTGGVVDGQKIVPTGTNLINFRTGDYAKLTQGTCKCGRTTPVLSNLTRKEDVQIKAEFGCQVD